MTFTREMILDLMEMAHNQGSNFDEYPKDNLIILDAGGGYSVEFEFDDDGILIYVG